MADTVVDLCSSEDDANEGEAGHSGGRQPQDDPAPSSINAEAQARPFKKQRCEGQSGFQAASSLLAGQGSSSHARPFTGVTTAGERPSVSPSQTQSTVLGTAQDLPEQSAELSAEQAEVLGAVRRGENVFFTGNAGTGKSFLLNRIIDELRKIYGEDFAASVAICASTGIAATHVGGTTVHSAFGIGVPKTIDDFGRAWKEQNRDKIRNWKVLLVDEVSMISAEMFEHLEQITGEIRGSRQPFGGLQLVLCGDFFQLPPIREKWHPSMKRDVFLNRGYTFQAPAWKRCGLEERVLTKVFRQKDARFVRILDAIRYNEGAHAALQDLQRYCQRPLQAKDGIEPTSLFSRNADVNMVNEQRLAALPGDQVCLQAINKVTPYSKDGEAHRREEAQLLNADFFRDCLAPSHLNLKVGAQVMLLRNLDLTSPGKMLVNGSRGVVTEFITLEEAGATALEAKGAPGSLDWRESWHGRRLPKVRFLNGREEVLAPHNFSAEVPATGTCTRLQVPLKLAWAMTIHKCQGMTLDYVRVSLQNIFAEGQAYVALSRARSLEGLEITGFSPNCVKTSNLVKRFHQCLVAGKEFLETEWDALMKLPKPTPQNTGGPGNRSNQPARNACFKCGEAGHWASQCPRR